MPRPKRCRKVCCLPRSSAFTPVGKRFSKADAVIMSVDEYETIRLIDYQGFTQEECGGYMNIARTTVQQVYCSARHKLAVSLVEGKPLLIEGGDYSLCDGKEPACACGGCRRHRCIQNDLKGDIET
ncbi:MAG: DUF134 domain-containing protein [Oscillospiraceae bacterium]